MYCSLQVQEKVLKLKKLVPESPYIVEVGDGPADLLVVPRGGLQNSEDSAHYDLAFCTL